MNALGIHKVKLKVAQNEKRKKLHWFSFSINIANFEAFRWTKKLISNLFFLKSASLSKTVFTECDSQGRLIDTDKWDNHNTIARGWLTSGEDHYQPVTFRKIYNSKNQPMGVSPMPNQNISHADMEQMAQQAHHQQMMHPSNDNNTVPVDVPEEGCADL